MSYPIHFVHLSDSHLGASRAWTALGNCPYRNLERVIDALNGLPTQPHFVIHTGDVANHDEERAYELAGELFSRLSVPVYFVTGNHDVREYMHHHLSMGEKEDLRNDGDAICYRFSIGPEHFLVLDSQQPFAEAGHFGKLSDDQLGLVRDELSRDDGLLSVFIHHAPVDLDSKWCRNQVGMLNGEALHSALLETGHGSGECFSGTSIAEFTSGGMRSTTQVSPAPSAS